MKRLGRVLGVKPERIQEYIEYHRKVWPEILQAIADAGITNYSIYLKGETLFAYCEYVGPESLYEEKMRALAAAPRMREWWDLMEPMQAPLSTRKPGEWWADMDEVFHTD